MAAHRGDTGFMEPYDVAAALRTVLGFFGSAALIVRMVTNSPRRRALADAEKQERLRELGALEGPQVAELRAQLRDREVRIAELIEERDFLRRLVEERERAERDRPGAPPRA